MMAEVYISVGSNIDPEINIPAALKLLKEYVNIVEISTFYISEAWNSPGAPNFYNGAVKVETDVPPRQLKFDVLRGIEEKLNRVRTEDKNSPRTIDLDIILYGTAVIREPGLIIPDPGIYGRNFILLPVAELTPDLVLPDTGRKLSCLAKSIKQNEMQPLNDFTQLLREVVANEP